MQIEVDKAITAAVEQLLAEADGLKRGDVLAHETIEAVIGAERNTDAWKYIVQKFRKLLLRARGIALRPVNGVGYLLLTEADQVRRCGDDRQRKARRQIKWARREVGASNPAELSIHDQSYRASVLAALKKDETRLNESIWTLTIELKKESNPKRPDRIRPPTIT